MDVKSRSTDFFFYLGPSTAHRWLSRWYKVDLSTLLVDGSFSPLLQVEGKALITATDDTLGEKAFTPLGLPFLWVNNLLR